MFSNIIPFSKQGRYTDIRVCVVDLMEKLPGARHGIIVLFDEDGMHTHFVCDSSDLALAGAELLRKAVTVEDAG